MNIPMKATSVTTFRATMKHYLDQITDDKVALIVTRPEDKNVVVISEAEFVDLVKRMNNLEYHLKLSQSANEAAEGKFVTANLEILE